MVAFDEEMLLQEMIDEMLEEGNSRYPVFREDLDNIVGIVNYKDALKFMTKNPWAKFKPLKELPGLIRTADFIPETRGIGDLFHTMQAKKLHMAIVVDEYGQTAGLVSMEDILEEIVGEILDEYDEDEVTIRPQIDNSVMIDGLVNLEDVEEELGVDFGDCEFETLNGYLTSLLGHIPTKKDLDKEIVANGYRFQILSLGNKTIGRVRAVKNKTRNKRRRQMSGHSKFANIKHKKEEKRRRKKEGIFTVIGREIVMAVKAGGPDPNNNSKLRDVIAKAKANNMPNDTIDRGIKKGSRSRRGR